MWEDYAKTIGKTTNSLTQQEKIQAEVSGIMEETKFQVGDAARYTETYAGQLSAFTKVLGDIKTNIGNAFMPIFSVALPALTSLANKVSAVTSTLAQLSQALFGTKKSSSVSTTTKGIDQQTKAVEGLGKATETASKKASKSIAGFDEINQLSLGDSGGSGSIATEEGTSLIEDTIVATEELGETTEGLSPKILKMAEDIRSTFTNMKKVVKENADLIVAAISGLIGGFAAFKVITNWSSIVTAFGLAFTALKTAIMAINAPVLIISAVIGALVGIIVHLWKTNEDFRNSVTEIWTTLCNFLKTIVTDTWKIIKDVWDKYGQGIMQNLLIFIAQIQQLVVNLWEGILKPIITGALELLSFLWDTHIKDIIMLILNLVAQLTKAATDILAKFIMPIVNFLVQKLTPVFKVEIQAVKDILQTFLDSASTIVKGVLNIFNGLINFIAGVFTGDWRRAWEGVKQIFKGIFDSLWGIVKTPLNLIIDGINHVIGALNSINISLPDWDILGSLAGQSFGINIPKIPKLARGGIVDGTTNFGNFIAGESGAEMIVPLENTSFTDKVASALGTAVMTAMQLSNTNNSSGDTVLQIDGTTFAKLLNPYMTKENRRIGQSVLLRT